MKNTVCSVGKPGEPDGWDTQATLANTETFLDYVVSKETGWDLAASRETFEG